MTDGMKKPLYCLTWVSWWILWQSIGQIGQLADMVTILQGAHVHVVPLVKLTEPERLLLRFRVRVQYDAHP